MKILSLIIRREFISKVRNKSFIVTTFLSPLIFVGVVLLIGYLASMKSEVKQIAIHAPSTDYFQDFVSDESYHFSDVSALDQQFIKDSLLDKTYYGLLVIPKAASLDDIRNGVKFYSNDSPSSSFINSMENIVATRLTKLNYQSKNWDVDAIEKAKMEVEIQLAKASGEQTLKGINEIKIFIGGAFGYLIMMFIMIYGNMVMRSVIEEKTNRIIEIIISSVKPFKLMMGKIVGTSLAGILQLFIWLIIGGILMLIASSFFGINNDVNTLSTVPMEADLGGKLQTIKLYYLELLELPIATIMISFILFFIGGYFLYSSFYAAIGAAVDNETDSQQFLFPIMMPLILGVYIGFFTVLNDPHGPVATIFSFIPLTSPIVMLMRIPFGVPLWQIVLSICVLFGTFIAVVWVASKIYRVGILMYGKKTTWKEMYKWLKY